MRILKLKLTFLIFALACLCCSCDDFKDSTNYSTDELEKHINGSWRIAKATRNGLDITRLMDFSQFRLVFNDDKTYTIENYLPFLVRQNGQWSIDDIKYPSRITFNEDGSQTEQVSGIEYVIVKGERQLTLTFTPGYRTNVYSYVFERVAN